MKAVSSPRTGLHLLDIVRTPAEPAFLPVRVTSPGGTEVAMLPALPRIRFLVNIRKGPVVLEFHDEDVDGATLLPLGLGRIGALAQLRRKDLRLKARIAEGLTVIPILWSDACSREFARSLRLMYRWGFGLGTRNFQKTPALFQTAGRNEPARPERPVTGGGVFAVVLHLHYPDLWPEFEAVLRSAGHPFKLLLTTTSANDWLESRVKKAFPSAEMIVLANRGRDVGPFVELLSMGAMDRYPLICKVHGKRSAVAGAKAMLGDMWRRATLFDLLGGEDQVSDIIHRFDTAPTVGMIGSGRFRLPNAHIPIKKAWGPNRAITLDMAARLGMDPEKFGLDFFAGTMFWSRSAIFDPIRRLGLRLNDFPVENGAFDGEIHHAFERIFGALPAETGMTIENAPLRFAEPAWSERIDAG